MCITSELTKLELLLLYEFYKFNLILLIGIVCYNNRLLYKYTMWNASQNKYQECILNFVFIIGF